MTTFDNTAKQSKWNKAIIIFRRSFSSIFFWTQDINNDKCFYIINDSEPDVDGGNWINDYPKFLKDAGINPSKCNILTAKTTYKNNQIQYFKNTYYWTLFERLVQNNHQKV